MTPCYTDVFTLLPTDTHLNLRLFLDGNTRVGGPHGGSGAQYAVAEAYFQHGRVVLTMPLNGSCTVDASLPCAWDVAISTPTGAMSLNATAYELDSIWA